MKRTFLFALLLLLACASTNGRRPHRDRYIIRRDEIEKLVNASTALDIIRICRPGLLTKDTRKNLSLSVDRLNTLVIWNNMQLRGKWHLSTITNDGRIWEIEYIDGYKATIYYGTAANGGAFIITQK